MCLCVHACLHMCAQVFICVCVYVCGFSWPLSDMRRVTRRNAYSSRSISWEAWYLLIYILNPWIKKCQKKNVLLLIRPEISSHFTWPSATGSCFWFNIAFLNRVAKFQEFSKWNIKWVSELRRYCHFLFICTLFLSGPFILFVINALY